MDPSHDERGPPNESLTHQSSSRRHGDAPPPTVAPPQMMYYYPQGYAPQPMPHQGYPPGYAPYPNEYHQQPYHYPAGPYFSTPPTYHNGGGSKAFIRGFIMCSCLIFTCLFVATLIMALVLHPQLPVYTINSLSVANFNTTQLLTANWNTSIMIHNINNRLIGLFSDFKVDLLHKNYIVAVSYVPNFELNKNEVKRIDATPLSNGFSFPKSNLDDMAKEQAGGSVTFALRMTSMVTFMSSTMSTRNTLILALCSGLKVVFQNNTGNGVLDNAGKPISCQLYM
ncbi:hypothetical protein AAZX31_19G186000 [Glycine max]|uniref:Late embryogenesis abundant protein LEA-2 subgroup domain-containing protein n=2 Tax=Glycine subgen. Soja TaxID=1462606 RepID=I1NAT9_SOYBN|nr:uncharacterized protein LOC100808758 [Glycine max]XP_028216381.1 uncharacterized protein LOC114398395 [Glycine soja]KAG4913584.1 hypothetical protein JHK86_054017 [Glycine max]KAG4916520.1 hypothetical protein JHK87_054077 [Glycine soja]KAG4928486.1 hypothetical protein JHK85_054972 [Glycine max]KAG5084004.1 hypothetical protein JHK84_054042 [Glycine max]KAG5086773.1 hypothetical protein JHK82_054170 [Glycine max]|eukprot:XP_003554462.1 uncharacterized protein LOC100808758 [Glycine max]